MSDPESLDVFEIEIRRTIKHQCSDVDVLASGPKSVVPLLREILGGREQESFVILCLDIRNRVIAWREVARGSSVSVQVPVRDLFRTGLLAGAQRLIIAHNHPSGKAEPSSEDAFMTQKLAEAGRMVDCPIADHIIITDTEYYSFAEKGFSFGGAQPLATGPRQGPELD